MVLAGLGRGLRCNERVGSPHSLSTVQIQQRCQSRHAYHKPGQPPLPPRAGSDYSNPALYSNDDSFAEARYWDDRYRKEERTFEWYRDFSSLEPLLKATFPLHAKLLQVGMGTSELQYDMVLAGYQSVHSVDFSQVAVDRMAQRHAHVPQLSYAFADCRDMQAAIHSASIDGVLDKGTLDALLCGDDDERDVLRMLQEVYRILRPGGQYMMITYSPPKVRLRYALQTGLEWSACMFWEVGQQGALKGPIDVDVSLYREWQQLHADAANGTASRELQASSGIAQGSRLMPIAAGSFGSNACSLVQGEHLLTFPTMQYSHFVYVVKKPA